MRHHHSDWELELSAGQANFAWSFASQSHGGVADGGRAVLHVLLDFAAHQYIILLLKLLWSEIELNRLPARWLWQ
jgi:hypothetical protein